MGMGRWLGAAVLGLVGVVLGGCGGGASMGKYNVTVSVDQAWRDTGRIDSIEVDVVGVNQAQMARWSSYPVSSYFSSGDQLRADANKAVMRFWTEDSAPKTLSRSDDKWDQWLGDGATHLFVVADLLGVRDDLPGDADPRRLILPLSKDRWKGRSIEIEIQRSGLVLKTPMKPVKQ